jgi:hypothetical protein
VRAVWTRVLADALYEQWRAEKRNVETTSLPGPKNGNAPPSRRRAPREEGAE